MAQALTVHLDTRAWQQALDQLGKRAPVAIARGLNRTGTSGRTAMARAVAGDMGIKVADARDAITVGKASRESLAVRITAKGRPLPLEKFKARGTIPSRGKGQGVSYVMRGERKRIANAFRAQVGNGHTGVFRRKGRARLPVRELFGPSIAHVFGNQTPVMEKRIGETLQQNVAHEIAFELSRLKG